MGNLIWNFEMSIPPKIILLFLALNSLQFIISINGILQSFRYKNVGKSGFVHYKTVDGNVPSTIGCGSHCTNDFNCKAYWYDPSSKNCSLGQFGPLTGSNVSSGNIYMKIDCPDGSLKIR